MGKPDRRCGMWPSKKQHQYPPRPDDTTASLWSCVQDRAQTALLRVRDSLDAEFDSSKPAHAELLSCLWAVQHEGDETVIPHESWKALGFQGLDPITDIRAGGLLSLLHLAGLASAHRDAYRTMLQQIAEREASEGVEGFYPLCTTSVNVTKRICDALLVSQPGKPATAAEDLRSKTESSTMLPASPLWLWVLDEQSVALFHIHVLADFHTRFMRERAGYMDCGRVLDDAMDHLLQLAAHCSSTEHIQRIYRADTDFRSLIYSPADSTESPTGCERVAEILWVRKNMNGILEKDLLRVQMSSSAALLEKDLQKDLGRVRDDLGGNLEKDRLRWNADLGQITDGMLISAEQRRILELGNVGEINAMLETAQRKLLDTPRANQAKRKALKQHVLALKDAVQDVVPILFRSYTI